MEKKITPKSLVLGLLQASGNKAIPIKGLVLAGEIFGFTGNTIRVTMTRLVREGTIESNERGLYCLSDKNTLFSRFIESWRDGEGRLKDWDGGWVCCMMLKRTAKRKPETQRALDFSGFKEGLPGLWVRPDNLTVGIRRMEALLVHFGKLENKEMFVARDFSDKQTEKWMNYLWPVDDILERQQAFLLKMEKSAERIEKIPLEQALIESCLMGREAIHLLITDPLLPEEIMDKTHRVALTKAMSEYDELGKKVWSKGIQEIQIDQSPALLHLVS